MEWVETTGKDVAEAIAEALDRLGVAESDAEVIVLEEPKSSMLGLRRTQARIRARVRPVQQRAKRPTRRPSGGQERGGRRQGGRSDQKSSNGGRGQKGRGQGATSDRGDGQAAVATTTGDDRSGGGNGAGTSSGRRRSGSRNRRGRSGGDGDGRAGRNDDGSTTTRARKAPKESEMSIETQQELAGKFVREVVANFGLEATTTVRLSDDEIIFVDVDGSNLGLLVGPRGATIEALQELTRTVVQRHSDEHTSRIIVDVGGYRERRAAALRQFALEAAADVLASGEAEALEPMNPADRKVVHDAINDVDGVETTSEGVEPRRHVVIRLAASAEAAETAGDEADDLEDEEIVEQD